MRFGMTALPLWVNTRTLRSRRARVSMGDSSGGPSDADPEGGAISQRTSQDVSGNAASHHPIVESIAIDCNPGKRVIIDHQPYNSSTEYYNALSDYHTSARTTILLVVRQGYNKIYSPTTSHKRVVAPPGQGILGSLDSLVSFWLARCILRLDKH